MPDRCPLCERRIETFREFCSLHQAALKNLEDGYATWSKGYGPSLTKELYYTKLESLSETGQAVKDVIKLLKRNGER
jgi:predicted amidophosphoribosyltransferase